MHELSTVLILLCIVTILAFWTRSWSIPYPTLMVLVGVAIAFVPGLRIVALVGSVSGCVCWADGPTEGIVFVFCGHTIACHCSLGLCGLCFNGPHVYLYRAPNARGGDYHCDRGAIGLEQFPAAWIPRLLSIWKNLVSNLSRTCIDC